MKITILTYGSRGDVQPFVALAVGLQQAGHAVCLAAPERFAGLAAQHGIAFAPLPGDPETISVRINAAGGNVIRMVKGMSDYIFSIAAGVARTAAAACNAAELVVHSFLFTTGGHAFARQRGIPDVSVQTFPIFAPTRTFPAPAMPGLPPGALSYGSHWLSQQIFWRGGNLGWRRLQAAAPELRGLQVVWPFDAPPGSRPPRLFAYSPHVAPPPADWTAPDIHTVGYFFLDTDNKSYQPPPDLQAFLAAGPPPVCVTFGSMINAAARRRDQLLHAALAQTGQRGLILGGWGGQPLPEANAAWFYLEAAPHDWLLPRCAAVIHHGGAGTTGAGLRAGIPNIIIPHGADQWFWGRRVAALGAGPPPLELRQLSVAALAAALARTNEPALRRRAQELGALIAAEAGVGRAVALIEQHAGRKKP
jgi:sterol 3beta-glucosyltransferase